MSFVPMTAKDAHADGGLVVTVWQFVTRHGWREDQREDVVQEMLCEWFTRPGQPKDFRFLYLHALDRLHLGREAPPPHARREPGSYTVDFVSQVYTQELLRQIPSARSWLTKIAYANWNQADAARQEGVTGGAITLRLQAMRQKLVAQGWTP